MANAGGSSLAKSGSSVSVADKFAEARTATRAPGMGAAAAATFQRQAHQRRMDAAAQTVSKLRRAGFRGKVWEGKAVQEQGGASTRGMRFDEGVRVYVSQPRGTGFKDHGYITIMRNGSRNYDGLATQRGTIRNAVE